MRQRIASVAAILQPSQSALWNYCHRYNANRRTLLRSLSSNSPSPKVEHYKQSSTPTKDQQQQHQEQRSRIIPNDGLTLGDFVQNGHRKDDDGMPNTITQGYNPISNQNSANMTFHIQTYGCQMNVNDSDIVRAILLQHGFQEWQGEHEVIVKKRQNGKTSLNPTSENSTITTSTTPDIILTNTCAIREKAESKVWQRLRGLKKHKSASQIVGVLGCMAERLQSQLLEENVAQLVVGPDQYRQLPELLQSLRESQMQKVTTDCYQSKNPQAMNVELSWQETYDDIVPIRDEASNPFSAFVSIQRGCSNRCSFCIVPFTRGGKERSRSYQSIIDEIQYLVQEQNLKEVVLLGQNVNSYHDTSDAALQAMPESIQQNLSNDGFRSRIHKVDTGGYRFVDLVEAVSDISPELRVRFTSPHPKDYPVELLHLMAERSNVCSQLHMPAQSGNSSMLKRMKRGYTREAYVELIDTVHSIIPDVALSSDFIAGFCDETEEEHQDTLSLLEYVQYEQAYLFAYSMREKTHAHRVLQDNVPADVKQRRLQELIDVFREKVHAKNVRVETGRLRLVLVEGPTKKQNQELLELGSATWHGRTDQNKRVLFTANGIREEDGSAHAWNERDVRRIMEYPHQQSLNLNASVELSKTSATLRPGDYAVVYITEAKGHTLRGRLLWQTSLFEFNAFQSNYLQKMELSEMDAFKENLLRYVILRSEPEEASDAYLAAN